MLVLQYITPMCNIIVLAPPTKKRSSLLVECIIFHMSTNCLTVVGKEWLSFALQESHLWAQRYQQYLTSNKPLLILNYNELDDPNRIQNTILKITNFLHVPVKHSVLNCVVENSQSFHTRPRPLRIGFQPFSLLPMQELSKLRRMENFTESGIRHARASYRPKVHV